MLIIAYEEQELPFDLDIEAVRLKSNENETTVLALAADQSLYGLQRSRAGTSVAQSIKYLRDQFSDHGDFRVRQTVASIDDNAAHDPVKARLLVATMLSYLGAEAPQLALPSWPGRYPDPAAKRCFHVTAFGPAWSNTTSQVVKQACGTGIVYVRGDQVLARTSSARSGMRSAAPRISSSTSPDSTPTWLSNSASLTPWAET